MKGSLLTAKSLATPLPRPRRRERKRVEREKRKAGRLQCRRKGQDASNKLRSYRGRGEKKRKATTHQKGAQKNLRTAARKKKRVNPAKNPSKGSAKIGWGKTRSPDGKRDASSGRGRERKGKEAALTEKGKHLYVYLLEKDTYGLEISEEKKLHAEKGCMRLQKGRTSAQEEPTIEKGRKIIPPLSLQYLPK